MNLSTSSHQQLESMKTELEAAYAQYRARGLKLDLTRGKPSSAQLTLSDRMDGILDGNYTSAQGIDTRNYSDLQGIGEMRELGASVLDTKPEEVIVGGSSSLNLMYFSVLFCKIFGLAGAEPWDRDGPAKVLCPVPGYDRHFAICEQLGIEMVCVPLLDSGPDMDEVERLVADDHSIKAIWNVPKYSNPTGITYSDETVRRMAALGKIAAPNFRVFWDNAYAVHDLSDTPDRLLPIMAICRELGTEDSVIQFASTSKITFAGAGISFIAGSERTISSMLKHLGIAMICADKVNQLRHARMFPDRAALNAQMQRHKAHLLPRFEIVEKHLRTNFSEGDLASWNRPRGGYFVSFNTRPGLASEVVKLCADVGVKLTPAGATYPYGKDPSDSNIRLAPSVPGVDDIDQAMEVFCCCVKLASVRQTLARASG